MKDASAASVLLVPTVIPPKKTRVPDSDNAVRMRRAGHRVARLPGRAGRSGKLDRARSRLYRGQSLQENMRLKALAEIYTMRSFAQLCGPAR